MAERKKRKPISKKTRFEVFKRDKFTCQYCGRMAPDVILEVDHIKPVAEGGGNGMMNLITSCRDCNRGKGKTTLSNTDEIKKQQKEMVALAEKREQLNMLMEWRTELSKLMNDQVDYICDYWYEVTCMMELTASGRAEVVRLLKQFSLQEILDAIDIAITQYYKNSERTANIALHKLGGICYNRRHGKNGYIQKHSNDVLDGQQDR